MKKKQSRNKSVMNQNFYYVSDEFVAMVNKLNIWATIWVNFSKKDELFNGCSTRIFRDRSISYNDVLCLKNAISHFFLYFPSFRSEQLKNACEILDYLDKLLFG